MEDKTEERKECCCTSYVQNQSEIKKLHSIKKSTETIRSTLLSVAIAFFPKCPLCVAAYLSMFGSFSLINTAFVSWIFPLLLTFLGLHLLLLLIKSKKKGYGPFILSLAGAALLICNRILFDHNKIILICGILFILSGSLWNSFSTLPISPSLFRFKKPIIYLKKTNNLN